MKAIEILFMFFTAVIAGDFKKAHGLTSKTWAENNGPDVLKEKFKGTPKDLSFEVDRVVMELPTEQVCVVKFETENQQGAAKVGLLRESWPGKRNAQGDWGVDPDNMEPIRMTDVKKVSGDNRPKDEEKPKAAQKKDEPKKDQENHTDEVPALIAKAEDLGIDIPEGFTTEQLQDLIAAEEKALQEAKQAEKPAPKKPASKKPAAKKGGK